MARRSTAEAAAPTKDDRPAIAHRDDRESICDAFRRWGYYGAHRYPLEGATAVIRVLDAFPQRADAGAAGGAVMGLCPRRRLDAQVKPACRPGQEVVAGSADGDPRSVLGSGGFIYRRGGPGQCVTL